MVRTSGITGAHHAGRSKRPDFSPAHPLADIFTHPTLRLLRNRFPGTCHLPGRGPADSPTAPERVGRLFFTARIERCSRSLQACSFSLQGWGLIDLPLRASNEGSPRPRVARAQKIIRLHPILVLRARRTVCLLPRTLLRPRVARARGSPRLPHPPFSASC
jgi:hypothetical protein